MKEREIIEIRTESWLSLVSVCWCVWRVCTAFIFHHRTKPIHLLFHCELFIYLFIRDVSALAPRPCRSCHWLLCLHASSCWKDRWGEGEVQWCGTPPRNTQNHILSAKMLFFVFQNVTFLREFTEGDLLVIALKWGWAVVWTVNVSATVSAHVLKTFLL